jgi:hypothetical protein
MIESHLADLEKHLRIRALRGENELKGYFTLTINEDQIVLKDLNPGCYMRTIIAPLSQARERENFFIHLMKANFLGQGTGGSVIAIDPDEKFLILSHAYPYEINYRQFKETLELFINYLEFWRTEIKKFDTPPMV